MTMAAGQGGIAMNTEMSERDSPGDVLRALSRELENFREIAERLQPQPCDVPQLHGIDIWGGTLALNGAVGGDLLIYVDFKKRFDLPTRIEAASRAGRHDIVEHLRQCQRMAGIALVDVAGHRITDALLAAMLHQAFLVGALYELDTCGQITKRLFENLNTRFYQSSGTHKFLSLLYGEISEDSRFRFLSAAQPFPAVFSNAHDRFMEVEPDRCLSFPPVGMLPSVDAIDRSTVASSLGFKKPYEINEWSIMGQGDILLLFSDGLVEHGDPDCAYFPERLEDMMRQVKYLDARAIYHTLVTDLLKFGPPSDDISLVVVKLAG
jgi:serine phosphatase RsbU (regulator of sigma subunit)